MPRELVTNCAIEIERLAVFADCKETYGMGNEEPDNDWPWNVLSKRAIAYSCGRICQPGFVTCHSHDRNELELCRHLASEAMETMGESEIGMGSDSLDPFRPYFCTANVESTVPVKVTPALIREAFGGTIFPPTKIAVEKLVERGRWWKQVLRDCIENEDAKVDEVTMEYGQRRLERWKAMVQWFQNCPDLHSCAFVMIGENPVDPLSKNCACVFPRLAVGLTKSGSLVGLGSWVVHT